MLMVPGANGDANIFKRFTEHLAAHYTVVTYDRHGFSRSQLDGPQDYEHRLETDADDVRRLIEHLSDEPATVFGSSSGGVVVLEVLTQSETDIDTHPSRQFPPPPGRTGNSATDGSCRSPRYSGLCSRGCSTALGRELWRECTMRVTMSRKF